MEQRQIVKMGAGANSAKRRLTTGIEDDARLSQRGRSMLAEKKWAKTIKSDDEEKR